MTVMALAKAGDNVVSSPKLYNGTFTQFERLLPSFGVTTRFIDSSGQNLCELIDKATKLVFCESVANPNFAVADYTNMIQIAHDAGVPVVVSTYTPRRIWSFDIRYRSTPHLPPGVSLVVP